MTHAEHLTRDRMVPGQIRKFGFKNVIVSRCIDEFVYGNIPTVEEMLYKMVENLARAHDEAIKVAIEARANATFIPTFTK